MPKEEHILCSMSVFVSSLLFLISWKSLLGNGYYIIYCRAYIKNQASISIKCSKARCRFFFLHTFIESLDFTLSTRRLRFFVPQIFWYVKSFPCSWLSRKPKPENFHPAVGKVSISSNAASFLFPFLFFYPPSIPCGQTAQSKLHLFAALVSKTVLLHRPQMLA